MCVCVCVCVLCFSTEQEILLDLIEFANLARSLKVSVYVSSGTIAQ